MEPIARETIGYAVRSLYMMGKEYFISEQKEDFSFIKKRSLNQIMIDPNMLSAANSIGGLNLGKMEYFGWLRRMVFIPYNSQMEK